MDHASPTPRLSPLTSTVLLLQAEYHTHLKEQYYLDQIKKDKEDAQAALDAANERYEGLRRAKEEEARAAEEATEAMEVAHMRAAEELEHLYEKKLAAEAARFEAMRMEKEDMQSQVTAPAYLSVLTCSHPSSPHR